MDAFDYFLNERLEKRAASEEELLNIKATYFEVRTRGIVEALIGDANASLSFNKFLKASQVGIVTVRRAFNRDSILLKPVATFPTNLLHIAHDFAKQLTPQTFQSCAESLEGIAEQTIDQSLGNSDSVYFSAVYKTRGGTSSAKRKSGKFSDRIDVAFERLRSSKPKSFVTGATCFFSVRALPYKDSKTGELLGYRIAQIVAIYFAHGVEIDSDNRKIAHNLCRSMFEEHDRIRELEENLFVLEGHELTASLQPLFLDADIAPADKIAFAVEKLKLFLKRHLHSHYPDPKPEEHDTRVFFVSLSYEVPDRDQKEEVVPTFQVYPHAYRRELAFGSFLIGHPTRPAISKYLLRKYLSQEQTKMGAELKFLIGAQNFDPEKPQPAKIHEDFRRHLFKQVDKVVAKAQKDKREGIEFLVNGEADQVYLSKANGDEDDAVWKELNVNVGAGGAKTDKQDETPVVRPNKSILAFVIEGHDIGKQGNAEAAVTYKQLPRAILAVESTHEEMLSEKERNSMRKVARSISHLVRHVFHDNTLLDYRRQLSVAYEDYVPHQSGDDDASLGERLILSAMSIDVSLLEDIQRDAEVNGFKRAVTDEIKRIYDDVFSGTAIDDEIISRDELVKERIEQRFERAVSYLMDNGVPSQEAVDFLEACPRNFAWAGYAPSLAQALGDRADHKPPRFTLMSPGFSASGLYMAVVKGEIRQVAKLSRVDKLMKERENYRQHVRYKVLVAARSPVNAFAFDSKGVNGKEAGESEAETFCPDKDYAKECYGVLVADLASSKKLDPKKIDNTHQRLDGDVPEVATFLDRVVEVIDADEEQPFMEVVQSLRALFENNFGHWVSTEVQGDNKVILQLREAFRLDYENKLDDRLIEEYELRLANLKRSQEIPEEHKPVSGRKDREWTELAFKRLGEGADLSLVEYERGLFPLEFTEADRKNHGNKRMCVLPKEIATFCCDRLVSKRGLNGPEKQKLLSISHRDLNAQNIVWAGPIQSFMMIDFEHTGKGYWGMDQARLAANTVVDFLSKSTEPGEVGLHFSEVANAAGFLVTAWKSLGSSRLWRKEWGDDPSEIPPCAKQPEKGQKLTCIVRLAIWLMWQKVPEFRDNNLLDLYQLELGYAVVKEYEYGMVNVRRAKLKKSQVKAVQQVIHADDSDLESTLVKVHEALLPEETAHGVHHVSDPRLAFQFAAVSRFLVARWILRQIIGTPPKKGSA